MDTEQESVEASRLVLDAEPDGGADEEIAAMLAHLVMTTPWFSLRGGTREILHGMVARGLGLR